MHCPTCGSDLLFAFQVHGSQAGRVFTSANYLQSDRLVEVSAPGVYEVSFKGVGADRFLPIRPRRVDVRPGETAEVIV